MDADFLIPIFLFGSFAYIIKVISDNRLKRMIVEKDQVSEDMKYLFTDKFGLAVPSSLKWGMVMIGVGAAIILAQVLSALNIVHGGDYEILMFALIFILGGSALIVYYLIANRMIQKNSLEK
jgi:hypothetical protein